MKNIKLIETRTKKGLTQVEIAEKAGITPVCYQRYESRERIPRADKAILIADILGIKSYKQFKELFGEETEVKKDGGI